MKKYLSENPFQLENGAVLPGLEIAYHTYGDFRPGRPVVWVCHALTANSEVFEWWPGLFGEEELFNPNVYSVICANVLGGCYGTTGPLSLDPRNGQPWYHGFPEITIRDMVKAHRLLADALGIDRIDLLVGGSLGGQQAIEWAIEEPERFRRLALIATNAQHSPWGIAFNESQRMAIASDPTWKTSTPRAGTEGLKAARAMALLSYRSYHAYHTAQSESDLLLPETFRAASYQHHQGEKLARRFNAYSYNLLSRAMDSHCVGRGKNGNKQALQRITAHTLVVGIASDLLFPVSEQEYLAAHIPDANLVIIDSLYGHDGFLIETAQLSALLKLFLINQSIEFSYGH
ncbi:MAG: homoserine O-acetyltransferase [Flavobacteriales bacterium]